jgi:hypothetical protein
MPKSQRQERTRSLCNKTPKNPKIILHALLFAKRLPNADSKALIKPKNGVFLFFSFFPRRGLIWCGEIIHKEGVGDDLIELWYVVWCGEIIHKEGVGDDLIELWYVVWCGGDRTPRMLWVVKRHRKVFCLSTPSRAVVVDRDRIEIAGG